MKSTDPPIVISQTFDISKEELWSALTDLNRMTKWFFKNIEAFKPEVGFQTSFVVESNGRSFPHLWTITESDPPEKITYNWTYKGYPGDSEVTFKLANQDGGTLLTVIHRVMESFPQDIPEFSRESCETGWNWFIRERLKAYLQDPYPNS